MVDLFINMIKKIQIDRNISEILCLNLYFSGITVKFKGKYAFSEFKLM